MDSESENSPYTFQEFQEDFMWFLDEMQIATNKNDAMMNVVKIERHFKEKYVEYSQLRSSRFIQAFQYYQTHQQVLHSEVEYDNVFALVLWAFFANSKESVESSSVDPQLVVQEVKRMNRVYSESLEE